jgi:DNA invertase Pin-like site-specific DNA recombinase
MATQENAAEVSIMTMAMTRTGTSHRLTFESLKGLRAEGYIRDSTLDQRDGSGPDIQRHNIQRFAESYGLILGQRWYNEFVSGRSVAGRKEFRQFIEDARLDLFDVLLVDHTSRFGRNQAECIRYKEEMQGLGKMVVFVSQGIISGSDRDFLSERINETLDEQYSRNLSRYVREGKAEKAARGHALGHAPLGYKTVKAPSGRGAHMAPDERIMPVLLALLRGYACGRHSFKTLAQHLNAQGYMTSRGNPFTESSINQVVTNPFYGGKFYFHKGKQDEELRDGVHQVPQEVRTLWNECQKERAEKVRSGHPSPPSRQHRVYPLTGVLVCDGCGRPFHGVSTISKPKSYPRMFHNWHRCGMRPLSVSAPMVEGEFADRVLSQIKWDDGWEEAVIRAMTNEGPQSDCSLEVKRIESAMANLRKQHLWGVITDEEFRTEHVSLERQKRALEAARAPLMSPNLDRAAQLLSDLPALWQHPGVTPEQRRELAREVFEEVRLREGRLAAVKPRPEYAPLFAYSIWRYNVVGGDQSF